jgi:hemoglobin-like flavoprotein
MTPYQISLVQKSWRQVLPISDTAADLFYQELFRLDPGLRALFKGDMKEQGRKLMAVMSVVVQGLPRVEALMPQVQDLGRRHARYGVRPQHYDTVAAALLWTLGRGLGDAFTPEVKAAWAETYTVLARTMKTAAAES